MYRAEMQRYEEALPKKYHQHNGAIAVPSLVALLHFFGICWNLDRTCGVAVWNCFIDLV